MSDWFDEYGFDAVADHLLVGAMPRDEADVRAIVQSGVSRVVCLAADGEYELEERSAVEAAYREAGVTEDRLETVDFGNLLPGHLERASTAIRAGLEAGDVVYVHCRAGWQRSVIVAAAALARDDGPGEDPMEALSAVMARRRGADPLPHQIADLSRWWRARGGSDEPAS